MMRERIDDGAFRRGSASATRSQNEQRPNLSCPEMELKTLLV
jgi:hypothetical protein